MSSTYAQGLEILAQVQEQVDDIKPDAARRRATVQKMYALSQIWNTLRMALTAAGEAADRAIVASDQQRTRYRAHALRSLRCKDVRSRQASNCRKQFRYVNRLSQHAWAVRELHEAALRSWANLQEHYQDTLGPQADVVPSNWGFLESLRQDIEAVKRNQSLEMVYIRWVQMRAATDLTKQAKRFHLLCARLNALQTRAENARIKAVKLARKMLRRSEEYAHLEDEVMDLRDEIQAL